jgi:hypothetical protein
MPLQNRVFTFRRTVRDPARGNFFGNRGGKFHRDDKTLGKPPLRIESVDLLRALLQGPAARRLGPLLYRALFSRRANRARGGASALFRMPPRGGNVRFRGKIFGQRASAQAHGEMDLRLHASESATMAVRSACIRFRSKTCPTAHSSRFRGSDAFAVNGKRLLRWSPEGYRIDRAPFGWRHDADASGHYRGGALRRAGSRLRTALARKRCRSCDRNLDCRS